MAEQQSRECGRGRGARRQASPAFEACGRLATGHLGDLGSNPSRINFFFAQSLTAMAVSPFSVAADVGYTLYRWLPTIMLTTTGLGGVVGTHR